MAKKKVTELVAELLKEFLEQNRMELYNCEFLKKGRDWFLRVYIDKIQEDGEGAEEYISTEDCEKVSRFLSGELDRVDPIEQNYFLEVSSPGMDRELIQERDFERYAGRKVDISLYKPLDGSKSLRGRLVGLRSGNIVIVDDRDGKELSVERSMAAKTCLAVEL